MLRMVYLEACQLAATSGTQSKRCKIQGATHKEERNKRKKEIMKERPRAQERGRGKGQRGGECIFPFRRVIYPGPGITKSNNLSV